MTRQGSEHHTWPDRIIHTSLAIARGGARLVAAAVVCNLLVVACGLPSETAAWAQTGAAGPRTLVFGSLWLEPAFAMHTGPNSNINKDEPSLAVKAFETAIIPHVDVGWRRGRQELRGFGALEFVVFGDPRTLAGTKAYTAAGHNRFGEAVWTARARLTPVLAYRYRNNGARANDIEEIAAKSRRVEETLSSSLDFLAGGRLHLVGEYARQRTRYDADARYQGNLLSDQLDYDRQIWSAGVGYELTPLVRVGTNVTYLEDRFRRNPTRNNGSVAVSGTAGFAPLALMSGELSVGVKFFEPRDPGAENFRGLVARSTFTYAGREATLATLAVNRETEYSYDALKSYYLSTELRASLRQRIVGRMECLVHGGIWTLEYRGAIRETDRQVSYGGGLGFRLRPWARTGVNADYIRREGRSPWTATRLVVFFTYGTRFRKLERTMPGEDYTK